MSLPKQMRSATRGRPTAVDALSVLTLALIWMLISSRFTVESLMVGLVAGAAITALRRPPSMPVSLRRVPAQLAALILWAVELYRDIIVSSLSLTRRVLSRDMRLQPGILAVSTQDEERRATVLAMSANYVTLTPGELVVEVADDHLMYVHCLDVDQSKATAAAAQSRRLQLLNRIFGRE